MGVENKKAVTTDPGEEPLTGPESCVTAFLLALHFQQCSHCITQCQVVQYLSCMVGFVGEELPEMAQAFNRGGNHMNHPTRTVYTQPSSYRWNQKNPTKKTGTPDSHLKARQMSLCV